MCDDEELFRKYCPDFCAGSKCLEPYFSVFQAGMDAMHDGEAPHRSRQEMQQEIISAMSEIMELDNGGCFNQDEVLRILNFYFSGGEARNKELVEENRRLQERIVKMRRCGNCRYKGQINNCTYKYYARCAMECKNYSLWEAEDG